MKNILILFYICFYYTGFSQIDSSKYLYCGDSKWVISSSSINSLYKIDIKDNQLVIINFKGQVAKLRDILITFDYEFITKDGYPVTKACVLRENNCRSITSEIKQFLCSDKQKKAVIFSNFNIELDINKPITIKELVFKKL